MVSPVMVQTMMVSMKVPVMETYPCRAGSSVVDAAAEIAAEPRPASLEKQPRATPKRTAFITETVIVPTTPPSTAAGSKAIIKMRNNPCGTFSKFKAMQKRPAMM